MASGPGWGPVLEAMAGRGLTLAVAESLTGGLVSAAVTAVPGSSAVLRGGVVAYAPEVKHGLLGVSAALLEREGTVHPEVALGMARGVRRCCGADWGLATTGVAGPGPAEGHPAGTAHIAVCGPGVGGAGGECGELVRSLRLDGDRGAVRAQVVDEVLTLLVSALGD